MIAIDAQTALQRSEAINPEELKGALWSADEMIVEARVAIEKYRPGCNNGMV